MSVTIKDVANEAGVAISTVSKALNNCFSISGETAIHVKEVAKRLGYHPNSRAQTLARKANKEVTFITHLERDIAFSSPHIFEIMAGAEKTLNSKGYSLMIRNYNKANICEEVLSIVESKSTDGLLLHVSVVTRELAIQLTSRNIPHVVVGRPEFGNSLCWIDNNNNFAGEIAAEHLFATGHKKIAFVGGHDEDKISQNRLDGASSFLKTNKESLYHVCKGDSTVVEGERMAEELLKLPELPDAVICANNLLAFGCLRGLQAKKIHVPKDISVITFDDYPLAQLTEPPLTTVSIDVYDMGVQAGQILVRKIKRNQMQVQTFATMPHLVVRESTRS